MVARKRSAAGLRGATPPRVKRKGKAPHGPKVRSRLPAKRLKRDKFADGVIEAIKQAEGLNHDCRAMLVAAVPWLFRRARHGGERHGLQACTEEWIGETMHQVEAQLQATIRSTESQVAEVESERADLEGKVAQAQGALREAEKSTEAAQARATASLEASETARGRLVEAQRARRRGEQSLAAALKDKQRWDDIIAKYYAPLKAEDAYGVREVERYAKVLAPLAEDLGLDVSLQTALPMSLRRPPGERSAFELAALDELGSALQRTAVKLAGVAEAHSSTVAELQKAEAIVHMEYTSSDEAQKAAALSARDARVQRRRLGAAASDAQARLAAAEERLAATRAAVGEKVSNLQAFRNYNLSCLDMLQGKIPERRPQ